jgi:nucleotide-binding universal stress UspA family protein
MAVAVANHRHRAVAGAYHRIVVPLLEGRDSVRAVEAACRLAAERKSVVIAVSVIEVPPLLPLDARMDDEEAEGLQELAAAEAIADAYGVVLHRRQPRARETATAVLDAVEESAADLVVVYARRKARASRSSSPFGRDVRQILRKAPCRVLIIAPPAP